MKKTLLLMFIVLLASVAQLHAENPPRIVVDGLDAYKASGYDRAFKILLKGSPLENDKTTFMNLVGGFSQIEAMYGKMAGYEILNTVTISRHTCRVYLEIRYEKGPVFVFVDSYKTDNGWIIPIMRFHTDAEKIFPESMISAK